MRHLILMVLPLMAGCSYFELTDVLNDVVQGPDGQLVAANATSRSLQLLADDRGYIVREFPLGAVPTRIVSHPDHSVVAVSYGETESRVDLIDVEAGTGQSVSLGKGQATDVAWAGPDRLYVVNDSGLQDFLVIDRDKGKVVGSWPLADLDFHERIAATPDAAFINFRRYDTVLKGDGNLRPTWDREEGDFTRVVHKQRLSPDATGLLFAANGDASLAEHSAETGAIVQNYDVQTAVPDQDLVDFTYDTSGTKVFAMMGKAVVTIAVFDRATGKLEKTIAPLGIDATVTSNFEVAYLVPGDESGEVFVYGHRQSFGSMTRMVVE